MAPELVEVRATGIRTESGGDSLLLVLEDPAGRRLLVTIAIGAHEAASIAFALNGVEVKRPMTHDALKQTVEALGAEVLRVIVGHLPESGTYTADVVLRMSDGAERHLDWRLSDSVALLVRFDPQPPIVAPESLLASPPGSLVRPLARRSTCAVYLRAVGFRREIHRRRCRHLGGGSNPSRCGVFLVRAAPPCPARRATPWIISGGRADGARLIHDTRNQFPYATSSAPGRPGRCRGGIPRSGLRRYRTPATGNCARPSWRRRASARPARRSR